MRPIQLLLGLALALALSGPPRLDAQTTVTLEEALARFHAGSPALALARSRLRAERAGSRQGAALPNPTATFSNEDLGDYSERYLTLAQRVDFLWDGSARGRRADALAQRARSRFLADSARLALEVERAHVAAWEAVARGRVLARTEEAVVSLLADARARFAEGDLAGYDVRRLEVEGARVARQRVEAEVAQDLAEARLAALVGGDAATRLGAAQPTGLLPVLPLSFDAVGVALARRPELGVARADAAAQQVEVSLARSSVLSGTSLQAGLKRQSDGQNGLFLGVQVPIPILDRKGSAVAAATAATAGAEAEVALVQRMVAVEALGARARLSAARRIAEQVDGRGIAEAADLLEIATLAYGEGEIGIVEMVDATRTFTEAALQGLEARVALWRAYFEFNQAVGGLADATNQGDER